VICDWLFAAQSKTSPSSCFYDTSQDISFDLFKWKSMEIVARAWASQWSWETDWFPEWNEPHPLVSYVQYKIRLHFIL